MFDEKEMRAYRNISAPADLKERVLSSCANVHPARPNFSAMIRTVSGAAACLVLVIVLSVFAVGRFDDTSVSVSGEGLLPECSVLVHPEHGVAPLSAHPIGKSIAAPVSIPVELTLSEETTITVSAGELCMKDADGEAHSFGTAVTACGTVEIDWYVIPNDTKNAFVMTLRGALKSETLTLVYDEDGDIWTFSRKGN